MKSHRISAILVVLVLIMAVLASCDDNTIKTAHVSTYDDLVSALKGSAGVVVLDVDINVEDTLVVSRAVTLDMNGKTLSNAEGIWNDDENKWSIISVAGNGNLTITGEGKIAALKDDCYAVDVQDNGKLTIENGEYIGNIHAIYVFEGSAEIKDGKYSIQQLYPEEDKSYEFVLNLFDANRENGTAKISVTGGEFVNFDPADNAAEGENTSFLAEGYKSTLSTEGEDTIYTVTKE